ESSFTNQEEEETFEDKSQSIDVYKLTFKELLFMALTSGVIGVAFATLSPIFVALNDIIPWHLITDTFSHVFHATFMVVLIIVTLVNILSFIIETSIEIINNFNYTVTHKDNQLNIQYGLLNVKSITVPTDRVQAVVERQ